MKIMCEFPEAKDPDQATAEQQGERKQVGTSAVVAHCSFMQPLWTSAQAHVQG